MSTPAGILPRLTTARIEDRTGALRLQVHRLIEHWAAATVALNEPTNFASDTAWSHLERYLDIALRREMQSAVDRLLRDIGFLRAEFSRARSIEDLERLRLAVIAFRSQYSRVELMLDFYGDAVSTRSNPRIGSLLAACDAIASKAMELILPRMGCPIPPVLTYVDTGLGASILRAGIRLWDPKSLSPAAAIKVTRHSINRPTALLHEAGHQVSFQLGWHEELGRVLEHELRSDPRSAAAVRSWASEMTADIFAFVTGGYGSVAGLHDVVAGDAAGVWRWPPGDPHPIAFLRVLWLTACCGQCFGTGPWDGLAEAWETAHPLSEAPASVRPVIESVLPKLRLLSEICLTCPMAALGNTAIVDVIDPGQVSPPSLAAFARLMGNEMPASAHWLRSESLRMLALSAYRASTEPSRAQAIAIQTERWMQQLGKASIEVRS